MKHEVFWKNPGYIIRPELKENIDCDYLIVGGGITGVSVAYFLSQAGAKNIVLIEKNYIASGATGKAAGSLVIRGETDLTDIIRKHGIGNGELYWKEIHEGLKAIKKVINDEDIDCDAEPQDTLYCGTSDPSPDDLDLQKEFLLEKGLEPNAKFLEGEEFKKEINTDWLTYGILSADHGLSVNPFKFTQNLSKVVEKYGVKIYENTTFLKSTSNIAKTLHGNIRYKKIIFAIDADYPSKEVENQKSTIVITRPLTHEELVMTGLIRKKIIFDNKTDYLYLKMTKENRLLIGFGITMIPSSAEIIPHLPHLKQIENLTKKLFPYLELEVEYAWSGDFGVTKDYHPLVEFKDNMASISGAGSQVVCFMTAKQVVNKILS